MTIDLKPEDGQLIQERLKSGVFAFAQLERGEGLTPDESLARLGALKATWRANHRRA